LYAAEDLTFSTDFSDKSSPKITGVTPASSADFSADYKFDAVTQDSGISIYR